MRLSFLSLRPDVKLDYYILSHILKKSQGEFDHFFKKKLFVPVSHLKAVLPSNITPNDFPIWEPLSKNRFIRDF